MKLLLKFLSRFPFYAFSQKVEGESQQCREYKEAPDSRYSHISYGLEITLEPTLEYRPFQRDR
jgi:hypothetical protein